MRHLSPSSAPARAVLLLAAVALACGAPRRAPSSPAARATVAAPAQPRCLGAARVEAVATRVLDDPAGRASVTVTELPDCRRSYALATTAALRAPAPPNPRVVAERAGSPALRSGHALFDGLYALALEEAREASVDRIHDDAFDDGGPLACPPGGCFETGERWTYVWTRDTAYATYLGLGALDPVRARNSLEFKLSARRDGGGADEIVQDTGSGGSYPISTDRVTWALGAWEVLNELDGPARVAFRDRAYAALRATLERDRRVVFDPDDGLYAGETSFLDWREQSYPAWTARDTAPIGSARALSTNAAHLAALEITARLADERGEGPTARRFRGWADALRERARARFATGTPGQLAAFVLAPYDTVPVARADLLGVALAVLTGLVDAREAAALVRDYPFGPAGPPVIFPAQRELFVYHNRAVWPFATALFVRAARAVGDAGAVERGLASLVRGAAVALSNMESFEWSSGRAQVADGPGGPGGPVINSRRQLWSVAGYLGTVHGVLFGLRATPEGLRVAPFVTPGLRSGLFRHAERLVLRDYPYRGRALTVVLALPSPGGPASGGAYAVARARLDGRPVALDAPLPADALGPRSTLELTLAAAPAASEPPPATTTVATDAAGPPVPRVVSVDAVAGRLRLALDVGGADPSAVGFEIYARGARVGASVPGATTAWTDPASGDAVRRTRCYSAELRDLRTGLRSPRSAPRCYLGPGEAWVERVPAAALRGGTRGAAADGRSFVELRGEAGERVTATLRARRNATYLVRLLAANGAGPVNTGVTCGVLRLTLRRLDGGDQAPQAVYLAAPHTGSWETYLPSTAVRVRLAAGGRYALELATDPTGANMSAFAHFARYTRAAGGRDGVYNRVRVAAVELLPWEPSLIGGTGLALRELP